MASEYQESIQMIGPFENGINNDFPFSDFVTTTPSYTRINRCTLADLWRQKWAEVADAQTQSNNSIKFTNL